MGHSELALVLSGLGICSTVFLENRSFFVSERAICLLTLLFCNEQREQFAHLLARVNRLQLFIIMSNFERKSEEGKSELLILSVTAA